jgi:hypothetical protein
MSNAPNFANNNNNNGYKYPHRNVSLLDQYSDTTPLIGHANPAQLIVGMGAAGFTIEAGSNVPGTLGKNMTLTISTGAGALAVTSNALDITVTLASGGSHASAVVTAINAAFPSTFASAVLTGLNGAGGTNVATLAKTNFTNLIYQP